MSPFRLFPESAHFWSLADYAAVLTVTQRLKPKRVLEFGPGHSTLALIEGGAEYVDALEDQLAWHKLWHDRLSEYPVTIRAYDWADPLVIPSVDHRRYDLGLVDGPFDTTRRPVVIDYCLQRCTAVLVPLEEAQTVYLRPFVWALAGKHGKHLEVWDTGPLAGAFALLT